MQIIDFDRAVQKQQIEAHYQPIIDLYSGVIIAIEARVRWNGGMGQHLITARHLLLAASTVQAHWIIDRAVLERTVEAFGRLKEEIASVLPVAVNISAETCMADESVAQMENLLVRSGIRPEQLRLEFPQDAFLTASSTVVPLIQRLADRGYSIAVDHVDTADFKAAHLEDIPVHTIKLHERLVEQAPGDAANDERIRGICLAAQKRGWRVGAEGVVRLEQLKFLRQAGCHEVQGALISRPQVLGNLMFLLKKGRCW